MHAALHAKATLSHSHPFYYKVNIISTAAKNMMQIAT